MNQKPFEVLGTQVLHQGRKFTFVEENYRRPDGTTGRIEKLLHPGAVVIVPQLVNKALILIHQYRPAPRKTLLEFPAGTLEPGESPLECAKREIIEECGYRAANWQELGTLYPAPGFCDEIQHCFLATSLAAATAERDEDEFIAPVHLRIDEVETAISTHALCDAKSIAIFALARLSGLLKV